MDATTRWETEALRGGPDPRRAPPKPTAKRRPDQRDRGRPDDREWVTLREAEAATGIPVSTLRKWVRRSGLASYLESDGDAAVRMVDLDAVRERATALGRSVEPAPTRTEPPEHRPAGRPKDQFVAEPGPAEPVAGETMIVPIDAWNKMLTQLGNLHEAGQQLAEARERAAKAETEAAFLRERLAQIRESGPHADGGGAEPPSRSDALSEQAAEPPSTHRQDEPVPTTTYWRYVTSGWRNRRRGSGS